ncbi:MAG: hypothetical protein QOJ29_1653 [Thermoleophilaceae bacterium]|nr:hypothetical protein [Thermoleophilaceae bacterium]
MLAAVLTTAPAAVAGPPGKWTQLGEANLTNIDQVALARTSDGTLHAVWTIPGANNESLVHEPISAAGVAAGVNVIQTGWAAISPVPDLVTTADGLRVFFGGIRTTDANEPNSNMNTATASPDGGAWSLFSGTTVKGDSAYASDSGAALLPDGTPLLSWGGTGSGVFVHRGLDPGTPNFPIHEQLGGCCGYSPDVAVDTKSGAPFVVWYSNATGKLGVWAQSLDPSTGAPTGAPANMPGSTTLYNGAPESSQMLQRTPIVARAGGGVYVAYPSGYPTTNQVRLWRIADSKSDVVATSDRGHIASLAAAPDGRLWVFWSEQSSPPQIFARRSNKSATKFGPAIKLIAPPGQQSAYKIDGNAQNGPLDLVVLFGTVSTQAQWHTQVLPALALKAKSSAGKVTFTVSDPDPVKGAKVSAKGKSAMTNATGHVTLTLPPGKVTPKATKSGYSSATLKLKVK